MAIFKKMAAAAAAAAVVFSFSAAADAAQTLRVGSLTVYAPFEYVNSQNGEYEGFDMATRKKLLAAFASFVRRLPIAYTTFLYEKKLFDTNDALAARMRRDVVTFLFDHLERFQSFDIVKVYYDDGQKIVSQTLRSAVGYALAKDSVLFRSCDVTAYRFLRSPISFAP